MEMGYIGYHAVLSIVNLCRLNLWSPVAAGIAGDDGDGDDATAQWFQLSAFNMY